LLAWILSFTSTGQRQHGERSLFVLYRHWRVFLSLSCSLSFLLFLSSPLSSLFTGQLATHAFLALWLWCYIRALC
jgi:hypothetical protein